MKIRIRGNTVRLRVSKTELANIAENGSAYDSIRFSPGQELRYGLEVRPAGAVVAEFDTTVMRILVPQTRVDLWLRPEEVSIEGQQPIGDGKVLQILVEKDYTCLAPRSSEDDSDLFANPQKAAGPGD